MDSIARSCAPLFRFVGLCALLLLAVHEARAAVPTATSGNQYRADTGAAIPFGSTIPANVNVYFEANVADADGNTIKMEVELRKLPATFTGTATHSSSLRSSGSRARTATASGLAAGNYGWRYRVVDSTGAASNWVAAGNPDFVVSSANQPPTHGTASQVRADTGAVIALGGTIPAGTNVFFRVTPSDPNGNTVRMEVELRKLPATFSGTATHVSSYVSSGSVATTATATGLAAGNYGWRYRVVDSVGAAGSWVAAGNPDFIVVSANQAPSHGIASQVRADTGAIIQIGHTVPAGTNVFFRVTPTDPDGNTVRMEVELRKLPATFTGTATHSSSYVSSGSVAATTTATGLTAGNYGWRYRVVDSVGAASNWVAAGNPDFIIGAANQAPSHGLASQVRSDTGAVISSGSTIPAGTSVFFRVTPSDPEGNTARMEVELRRLPATFTGVATHVSNYVSSGAVATTSSATGLSAGNWGWRYRVIDSVGAAGAWAAAGNPDFIVAAAAAADLVTANVQVSPNPATAGASVTVSYDVRNQGGTAAPSSRTKVQIKNASNVTLAQTVLPTTSVAANSSIREHRAMSLTGAVPGTYYAYVIVDSASEVVQASTSNDGQNNPGVAFSVQTVATPVLSVNPRSPTVGARSGTLGISVSNAGGSTLAYSASVTVGGSWVSIMSGASGGNGGNINVAFAANTGAQRVATIQIAANGAVGSPTSVVLTQAAAAAGPSSFAVGNVVISAPDGANIRSAQLAPLFVQHGGVHGVIEGGPIQGSVEGHTGNFWRVRWDSSPPANESAEHWIAESMMARPPTSIPRPDLGGIAYTTGNRFWTGGDAPGTSVSTNPWPPDSRGNCTWYAYGRMLELGYDATQLAAVAPVGLGSAWQWSANARGELARSLGVIVDHIPRVGAIAQIDSGPNVSLGHVAVVEAVHADGTITVTESSFVPMPNLGSAANYLWRNRTVHKTRFLNYIHVARTSATPPVLAVAPGQLMLSAGPGARSLSVANAGGGTFTYSADVVAGDSWLSISGGASGGNSGTVQLAYAANPGAQREAKVRVVPSEGQPFSATVVQAGAATGDIQYGVDVSEFNTVTDWALVQASPGVQASPKSFAFVRATSGLKGTDSLFEGHMHQLKARAPGILAGAYHFAYPNFTAANTGAAEAQHFLGAAGAYVAPGYLPPVLDIEDGAYSGEARAQCGRSPESVWILECNLTPEQLVQWIKDWIAEIRRQKGATIKPIIYTTRHYAEFIGRAASGSDLAEFPLWIAAYPAFPHSNPAPLGPWATWTFQQYRTDPTSQGADSVEPRIAGTSPGIRGYADLDAFNGDSAALADLAISGPAAFEGNSLAPAQLTLAPTAIDFGGSSLGMAAAPHIVGIHNTGGIAVQLGSLTLSGADAASFSVNHQCAVLHPGDSCTATLTFRPAVAGALSAALVATSQAGNTAIQLAGTGERSLVTHYYQSILRRPPDYAGKNYWHGEAARVGALGADLNEVWYALAMTFFTSPEYLAFGRDAEGYVRDLYNTFFGRPPDDGGLTYWTGLIASGMPRNVVLVSFMFSPEFMAMTRGIFGAAPVRAEADVVMDFYRGLLGRLPDSEGFNYWVGRFRSAQCQGPSAVYAAVDSISGLFLSLPEYSNRSRTNPGFVEDMYNGFMRRGGDLPGVQYWIAELDSGRRTREDVRRYFLASPEFSLRVGALLRQGCTT